MKSIPLEGEDLQSGLHTLSDHNIFIEDVLLDTAHVSQVVRQVPADESVVVLEPHIILLEITADELAQLQQDGFRLANDNLAHRDVGLFGDRLLLYCD